jgi:hypothetical protein
MGIAVSLFLIPAFIIRPFRHETPSGLALAMAVRQRAPWGTLAAALVCFLIAPMLWNAARRWGKAALTSGMVLVILAAVMARVNYFEWMFHPVESPAFESADAAKLDKSEMLMALRFGNDARAYPIRQMAYHHIVNDEIGGVPVAVTY